MRLPRAYYPMTRTIAAQLPHLRPAQCRGLALWVYGTVLAQSACQHAVLTALLTRGAWQPMRPRLREWLYDGVDKAAPCRTQVEVTACFAPLLRWVLTWWQGATLALDATAHGALVVALVISVWSRGSAIPVTWAILPANPPGAWMPVILMLGRQLQAAVPAAMTVLLLADRGLWSPPAVAPTAYRGLASRGAAQGDDDLSAAGPGPPPGMEQTHWLALLAEAYGRDGQVAAWLAVLADALEAVHTTGAHYYVAELYRLKGELLLAISAAQQTEGAACFRQALDIARDQQAKFLELRAATSLAWLWRRQGKHADARELLAPIYGWFTEGFDTADLQEAKALLEALGT